MSAFYYDSIYLRWCSSFLVHNIVFAFYGDASVCKNSKIKTAKGSKFHM